MAYKRRFKSGRDIVRWIEAKYTPDAYDGRTSEQRAIWFVAMQDALAIRENYRTKDVASMLVDGVRKYTMRDVAAYVHGMHEDAKDGGKDADACIEQELTEFWR